MTDEQHEKEVIEDVAINIKWAGAEIRNDYHTPDVRLVRVKSYLTEALSHINELQDRRAT